MNPDELESTMKKYGLTDDSSHLIELSAKQGPPVPGKPLDNLTDRQLADAVRMVLRSDIMLETICCAARDRIVKLSEQIEQLKLRTECQCSRGLDGERIDSPSCPVQPESLLRLQVKMRTRERDAAKAEKLTPTADASMHLDSGGSILIEKNGGKAVLYVLNPNVRNANGCQVIELSEPEISTLVANLRRDSQ